MKACWVVRSKIINKVHYKKYTDLFSDIIKKYNEKNFAHDGNLKYQKLVIVSQIKIMEFTSLNAGKKCWSSKEY